jgi:1,4-dihydroxy-2-naphthoyl-CoA synthase
VPGDSFLTSPCGFKGRLQRRQHGLAGIQQLTGDATMLHCMTEEAQEGRDAFVEHRPPDRRRLPRRR